MSVQSHDTCLIGIDNEGKISFFKSYCYLVQKEEAQSDLRWVQEYCHSWNIGGLSGWILQNTEGEKMPINIPHP